MTRSRSAEATLILLLAFAIAPYALERWGTAAAQGLARAPAGALAALALVVLVGVAYALTRKRRVIL